MSDAAICSACGGTEQLRNGSHWHGTPICTPCFIVWYDYMPSADDATDPVKVGAVSLKLKAEGKFPWVRS